MRPHVISSMTAEVDVVNYLLSWNVGLDLVFNLMVVEVKHNCPLKVVLTQKLGNMRLLPRNKLLLLRKLKIKRFSSQNNLCGLKFAVPAYLTKISIRFYVEILF